MADARTISLVKGREIFAFRYSPGDEAAVIDAAAGLARNQTVRFDWFDAAAVTHQVGMARARELKARAAE